MSGGQPLGRFRRGVRWQHDLPDTRQGFLAHIRLGLWQRESLPVLRDEVDSRVAVGICFEHSDRGAGDVQVVCPQPSPYYLAALPSDKPKFAAADVAMEAPFDPPEAPGVRHFVRRNVRLEGGNP